MALSDPAAAARAVRDYILEGVDPNPSLEGITTTGGRLNVNNAMQNLIANCVVLGTNDVQKNADQIKLYPNPTQGLLTINRPDNARLGVVSVYRIDGVLVEEFRKVSNNSIDISTLAQGMYVVRFSFEGDDTRYNKIIVKE
jgi:hypothetical protein